MDCHANFQEFNRWLDDQIKDEEKGFKTYLEARTKAAEVFGQNSAEVRKFYSMSLDESNHKGTLLRMKSLLKSLESACEYSESMKEARIMAKDFESVKRNPGEGPGEQGTWTPESDRIWKSAVKNYQEEKEKEKEKEISPGITVREKYIYKEKPQKGGGMVWK